eukprot:1140359-Pelagomonas_calceolata.AAC.3
MNWQFKVCQQFEKVRETAARALDSALVPHNLPFLAPHKCAVGCRLQHSTTSYTMYNNNSENRDQNSNDLWTEILRLDDQTLAESRPLSPQSQGGLTTTHTHSQESHAEVRGQMGCALDGTSHLKESSKAMGKRTIVPVALPTKVRSHGRHKRDNAHVSRYSEILGHLSIWVCQPLQQLVVLRAAAAAAVAMVAVAMVAVAGSSSLPHAHHHLSVRNHFLVGPHVAIEGHVLNETHVDRAVPRQGHKVVKLIIINAAHHHHVDLQKVQAPAKEKDT